MSRAHRKLRFRRFVRLRSQLQPALVRALATDGAFARECRAVPLRFHQSPLFIIRGRMSISSSTYSSML